MPIPLGNHRIGLIHEESSLELPIAMRSRILYLTPIYGKSL